MSEPANNATVLLSRDNPVFSCYCCWGSILILKVLLMAPLTAVRRITKKSFVNPEDMAMQKVAEAVLSDPDVERVRRAHLNDLENVLPYLLIALIYTATGPNAMLACILFRIAAVARIIHTAVYAFRPVPQPSRAIAFFTTFFISVYMIIYVLVKCIMFI